MAASKAAAALGGGIIMAASQLQKKAASSAARAISLNGCAAKSGQRLGAKAGMKRNINRRQQLICMAAIGNQRQ